MCCGGENRSRTTITTRVRDGESGWNATPCWEFMSIDANQRATGTNKWLRFRRSQTDKRCAQRRKPTDSGQSDTEHEADRLQRRGRRVRGVGWVLRWLEIDSEMPRLGANQWWGEGGCGESVGPTYGNAGAEYLRVSLSCSPRLDASPPNRLVNTQQDDNNTPPGYDTRRRVSQLGWVGGHRTHNIGTR